MNKNKINLRTEYGNRHLEIFSGDILNVNQKNDVLVISAFKGGYDPVDKTMMGALQINGISIQELQKKPLIDMRKDFHCWLSEKIENKNFQYILCLEMHHREINEEEFNELIANMFSLLATLKVKHDISIKSIIMPILGSGFQKRDIGHMVNYFLGSLKKYLDRYYHLENITICDISSDKIKLFTEELEKFFHIQEEEIFRNQRDSVVQTFKDRIIQEIDSLPKHLSQNKVLQEILTYLRKNEIELEKTGTSIRKFLESIDPNYGKYERINKSKNNQQSNNKTPSPIEIFARENNLTDITKSYLFILKNYGNMGVHYGKKDDGKLQTTIDELDMQLVLISFMKILEMYEKINAK